MSFFETVRVVFERIYLPYKRSVKELLSTTISATLKKHNTWPEFHEIDLYLLLILLSTIDDTKFLANVII
jgi:hypothetical protein